MIGSSVTISGREFMYEGNRFFVSGVTYAPPMNLSGIPTYKDLLADVESKSCQIHALAMKDTGINLIHVWFADGRNDHSKCMEAFQKQGIFVLVELHTATRYIDFGKPVWNNVIYEDFTQLIDSLASFPNLFGFSVVNMRSSPGGLKDFSPEGWATVKAVARDMKAYIRSRKYREIPIGAMGHDGTFPDSASRYLKCETTPAQPTEDFVDFWGLSLLSGCATSEGPDYGLINSRYEQYNLPLLFSEYGCIEDSSQKPNKFYPTSEVRYRLFLEAGLIYSPGMAAVWSGGIAYKWLNDADAYGLYDPVTVGLNEDGSSLVRGLNISFPRKNSIRAAESSASAIKCDQIGWPYPSSRIPPAPNFELCECMQKSLSCALDPSATPDLIAGNFKQYCEVNKTPSCVGVAANISTGVYGAFSVCEPYQQASWVVNGWWLDALQNKLGPSCTYQGKNFSKIPSLSSTCRSLLARAGPLGDKTIGVAAIQAPTSTGSPGSTGTPTRAADPTSLLNANRQKSLPIGVIIGMVLGLIAVIGIPLWLLWRKKRRVVDIDCEGLEVGKAPAGYDHVRNVELLGDLGNSELPVETKPTELSGGTINLKVPPVIELGTSGPGAETPLKGDSEIHPAVTSATVTDPNAIPTVEYLSVEESTERPFSSSWADNEWFDPNDPRQGLSGTSPVSPQK